MRIAEYKQIDERTEEYTVTIPSEYDEDGNIISEEHEEIRTRTVPIMGMVYRDMTAEEIAELPHEEPQEEPTAEERLSAIEDVLLEMMGCKL